MDPISVAYRVSMISVLLYGPGLAFGDGNDKDVARDGKPKGKFTIGKETTHVTGPVDKDGYVDYGSALNERLAKGVTPDINANVLLWKARGPAPEGKRMSPKFFEWLGMTEPPEKGEYFIKSDRQKTKQREAEPEREYREIYAEWARVQEQPWKAKEYPYVAAWLAENEKPLALVVQASGRTHYFSPAVPRGTDGQTDGLFATLTPGLSNVREFAAALASRAMLHLGEGRHDNAWQDLLALHRLGRLIARGGSVIECIVGIGMDSIASAGDLVFLDRARPDAKELKNFLSDLERLPPMPAMAGKFDLYERFVLLDIIMMVDRRGLEIIERLARGASIGASIGGFAFDAPAVLPKDILKEIDWDPALRNANQWCDRLAAALAVKDRVAREKHFEQIEVDLKRLKASLADSEAMAKSIREAKEPAKAKGKLVGDVLICLMFPGSPKRLQRAADRVEQTQRNLHVAFALTIYQREHGRYPKSLDALGPKYLARVPTDLFSGKALIYRPSEKGYLFYSVGVNGRDDGGRSYDDDPPGDDLRVRMPPKP